MYVKKEGATIIHFVLFYFFVLFIVCCLQKNLNYRLKQTVLHYTTRTSSIYKKKTRPTPSHMSGPNLQAQNFLSAKEKIFFTLFARALHSVLPVFSQNRYTSCSSISIIPVQLYIKFLLFRCKFSEGCLYIRK